MNEELEWAKIDRNSPIWGGSGCDYFPLEAEINSYWVGFYKDKFKLEEYGDGVLLKLGPIEELSVEENNRVFKAFEDGVFGNTQMKTEEYFRELWRQKKFKKRKFK